MAEENTTIIEDDTTTTEQDTLPEYTRVPTSGKIFNYVNPTGVIESDDGGRITIGVSNGGSVTVIETDAEGNHYSLYSGDGDDNEGWKTDKAYRDAGKMLSDMQSIINSEEDVSVDEAKNVEGGTSGGLFGKRTNASTTTNTGVTIDGFASNLAATNAVANAAIKFNRLKKASVVKIVEDDPVTVKPVPVNPETVTSTPTSFPTTAPTTVAGDTISQPVITGYYPNTTPNTPTSNTSVNAAQPSAIAGLTTSPTGARRINQLENIPLPASYTGQQTIDLEGFNQPLIAPTIIPVTAPVTSSYNGGNNFGITEINPLATAGTGVQRTYNEGGSVDANSNQFKGFKPEAMQRIADKLGYQGDMIGFNDYLNQNPDKMNTMNMYQNKAMEMAMGGMAKPNYAPGGFVTPPQQLAYQGQSVSELQANRAIQPGLVPGATVQPVGTNITADQLVSPYSGQVTGDIVTPVTTANTNLANLPDITSANTMTADTASEKVTAVTDETDAAQGVVDPRAVVAAQAANSTNVSELEAAQGKSILMENPVQRKVEDGELISGVANAQTAVKFTEEVQAATATPTKQATVQGQLEGLLQQFEGGNTPAWAAGAMRSATATMTSRGLGASSMAGQALIQAAMEASLPIASADAQVFAQFESQNLSNRQQRTMLAAQQRATFMGQEFDQGFQSRVMNASKVSDIANMNFTAEQQVALENSRNANTVNLSNLSSKQALVMAEAAALSNLDVANLNNRQQAAVMNAQSFLQVDMANLNNQQQTSLFKSQQQIQSLFTDQAATNAAAQFNATSENQTDQFFASLNTQAGQFNAAQANAQNQYNAGQVNAQDRFAAEMMNQRDQFNAQNRLVIDQNNANWRRQVATADTTSINRANEINASAVLGISNTAYNDLWSYYQDSMEWAWNSAENERQRIVDLASVKLQIDSNADIAQAKADYQSSASWGGLMATMFTSPLGGDTLLGKGLGLLGI